jgi:uncharacterized membrane protein
MSGLSWTDIHGGSTHFPIALLFSSFLFDLAAYVLNRDSTSRDLHAAAFYALVLGALMSFVAVLSGLVMTHWQFSGAGDLAKHHLFVWPAFGLIVALAVWRLIVRDSAGRSTFGLYLVAALVATAFMLAAGYWGGEMVA